MEKPLILISSGRSPGKRSMQRQQSELYGACLDAAGGLGVLFSGGNAVSLAKRCDGLLLSGGGDLHPARFGQTCGSNRLSIDPVRDAEEQALFDAFYARKKPVLGICRGIQAINVFLGGTLYQHIGGHSDTCHSAACNVRLHALLGAKTAVNSFHHQAVAQPGERLHVAARAPDGTIEALWHETLPILGIQWHPERMVPPFCSDIDDANHLGLFRWLLDNA